MNLREHSGNKYLRRIKSAIPDVQDRSLTIDVYSVLDAFDVRCPAVQHVIKKLLCAGLRNKGSRIQDISEAIDALYRAIQLDQDRQSIDSQSVSQTYEATEHDDSTSRIDSD